MYRELVASLTAEQKKQLVAAGIVAPTISNWIHGKRRPTLAQAKVLAIVTGADFAQLAEELADLEASQEQLTFFRRALERAPAVAGLALFIMLFYTATGLQPAQAEPLPILPATGCILC